MAESSSIEDRVSVDGFEFRRKCLFSAVILRLVKAFSKSKNQMIGEKTPQMYKL